MTRIDYGGDALDPATSPPAPWPMILAWWNDAQAAVDTGELIEPSAMAVATVDQDGRPDVRTVLARFLDPSGPGFVSASTSRKGVQLSANPAIAATWTWAPLFRAIRFRGQAEIIDAAMLEEYWHTRPWGSQIAAWASDQSAPAASREQMRASFDDYAARWPEGTQVPVPTDWSGWRVRCDSVELWAGRPDRFHDRVHYHRDQPGDLDDASAWSRERLQP